MSTCRQSSPLLEGRSRGAPSREQAAEQGRHAWRWCARSLGHWAAESLVRAGYWVWTNAAASAKDGPGTQLQQQQQHASTGLLSDKSHSPHTGLVLRDSVHTHAVHCTGTGGCRVFAHRAADRRRACAGRCSRRGRSGGSRWRRKRASGPSTRTPAGSTARSCAQRSKNYATAQAVSRVPRCSSTGLRQACAQLPSRHCRGLAACSSASWHPAGQATQSSDSTGQTIRPVEGARWWGRQCGKNPVKSVSHTRQGSSRRSAGRGASKDDLAMGGLSPTSRVHGVGFG